LQINNFFKFCCKNLKVSLLDLEDKPWLLVDLQEMESRYLQKTSSETDFAMECGSLAFIDHLNTKANNPQIHPELIKIGARQKEIPKHPNIAGNSKKFSLTITMKNPEDVSSTQFPTMGKIYIPNLKFN